MLAFASHSSPQCSPRCRFGCETVGKLIPNAHTVFFEQANHWLYLEQPDAFNKLVADFVHQGLVNVRGVHSL